MPKWDNIGIRYHDWRTIGPGIGTRSVPGLAHDRSRDWHTIGPGIGARSVPGLAHDRSRDWRTIGPGIVETFH